MYPEIPNIFAITDAPGAEPVPGKEVEFNLTLKGIITDSSTGKEVNHIITRIRVTISANGAANPEYNPKTKK